MIGGDAITGSVYGKPNRTIQLSNVACAGNETSLDVCSSTLLTPDEGRDLFPRVNVAGVKCFPNVTSNTTPNVTTDASSQKMNKDDGFIIGSVILGVLLAMSILVTLRLVVLNYTFPCVTMFSCVCYNNIYIYI